MKYGMNLLLDEGFCRGDSGLVTMDVEESVRGIRVVIVAVHMDEG